MATTNIIGAKVVEVSSSVSSEIDWQAVSEIRKNTEGKLTLHHSQYPTRMVKHYQTITLELPDGTRVDIEANSYYDSYWMEAR